MKKGLTHLFTWDAYRISVEARHPLDHSVRFFEAALRIRHLVLFTVSRPFRLAVVTPIILRGPYTLARFTTYPHIPNLLRDIYKKKMNMSNFIHRQVETMNGWDARLNP